MNDVARLISAIEHGDPAAAERLLPLVYDELRGLAARMLAGEEPGQTLQPTARLASGCYDNTVAVWDFPARKELVVYRGHSTGIASVAFRPDGRSIASSSLDSRTHGEIHLWDASTGRAIQVLRGHAAFVSRLAFLPGGRRLATLGDDGALKIWDVESGQQTLSIAAHERNGLGLAVSPDARQIATSGADGVLRVWGPGPTVRAPN